MIYRMDNRQELNTLITAGRPCIFISTYEEDYVVDLITYAVSDLDCDYWFWTITKGLHTGWLNVKESDRKTEHPAAALHMLNQTLGTKRSISVFVDLLAHLEDEKTLRLLREVIVQHENNGGSLILIDHRDEVPTIISAHATRFEVSLPEEKELRQIVHKTLRDAHQQTPIKVNITKRDMAVVIKNLRGLTRRQAERIIQECVAGDSRFDADDVNHVLAAKRQMIHADGLLEYVESPATIDEIGGLKRLKRWLKHRQLAQDDRADQFGLSAPRGVLLLGVQGAGKSLCAKAIAAAWQRPLLRLDPGSLYDRYVGESEKRLRGALHQAELMAPVILWIDEIEKGFASAAGRSTDGGLSQRMFGTLLTWMQDHRTPVFLVATANDIESLPPELLRKGRFDEIFFVDLPGAAARRQIFRIHLNKRKRDPEKFDLKALVDATQGYSGAEIEQGIIAALHEAYVDKTDIDTDLLCRTLQGSPPLSVTMAEKVNALRRWAEQRCVPADE